MDALSLQNLRCFTNTGRVPLARLTLLIGENSTGKSTFLAATRLAWDIAYSAQQINFNEDPFLLGAYDQIANYRGGRAGRAKEFEIAFERALPADAFSSMNLPSGQPLKIHAKFRRSGSHPVISERSISCGSFAYTAINQGPKRPFILEFRVPRMREPVRISLDVDWLHMQPHNVPPDWQLYHWLPPDSRTALAKRVGSARFEVIETLVQLPRVFGEPRPVAGAPVRTRPERTYNPISDDPLPEGGHVPMVLARTYFEHRDKWKALKRSLDSFGQTSGLFQSLQIKFLGKHESDPFQIRIKVDGPPTNLVDVGYGVSQVLPILVDSLRGEHGQTFLLQQPEVHLHPRGQAALGTFLSQICQLQHQRFVVETHSDFLIDRIRMNVRDGSGLRAEDVSILFFERRPGEVKIHSLTIDDDGNLENTPPSYRRFFMDEERHLLSF